jgi:hypothetical protein
MELYVVARSSLLCLELSQWADQSCSVSEGLTCSYDSIVARRTITDLVQVKIAAASCEGNPRTFKRIEGCFRHCYINP